MASLVFVEQHPLAGRLVELRDGATVGREGCDILLADPEVSRRHAVLRDPPGGAPCVEDLGSTNGTYVNDRRIDGSSSLQPGDTVRFGNTVWAVEDRSARTRAAAVVAP
jgi:pSer/pThr/pTyr-binding forkhead associated (FHA) protein